MTKPDKYPDEQWNRLNQPVAQQKLRKELLIALGQFLDTSPDPGGYPARMAEILAVLRGYAHQHRITGMDEQLKDPASDSQRALEADSAIGALAYAESQLRAIEYYTASARASTPDEADALLKKAQALIREYSDHGHYEYDADWKQAMDEARESLE
jgi:hypothetical protein